MKVINSYHIPESSAPEAGNVAAASQHHLSKRSSIMLRARSHLLMNDIDEGETDMITYHLVRIKQLSEALGFVGISIYAKSLLEKTPSSVSFSELEVLHEKIMSLGVPEGF